MHFYTNLDTLTASLLLLGWMLAVFGSFAFLFTAFRAGLLWGCAVLLLAPVTVPAFMIIHWRIAKKSFAIALVGYLLIWAALAKAGHVDLPQPRLPDTFKEA